MAARDIIDLVAMKYTQVVHDMLPSTDQKDMELSDHIDASSSEKD